MASTETKALDFERIKSALSLLTPKKQSSADSLPLSAPEQIISIREALFAQSERISVQDSLGRICASPSVSCPPAIPPIISGERIDSDTLKILLYYGITEIDVIKE
jgi:arginine/lysine/ornithine decarboxylase